MRLGNSRQVTKWNICDTPANEDVPFGYQVERFFKRNLDVVWRLSLLFVLLFSEGKRDVFLEILPFWVRLLDGLVVQAEVGDNDLFDALRVSSLQS